MSISSRQSRITSGLRADQHAAGADREEQRGDREIPGDGHGRRPSEPPGSCIVPCPGAAEVGDADPRRVLDASRGRGAGARADGADGGDEQQEGGDLERREEARQQQRADVARACRSLGPGVYGAPCVPTAFSPVPSTAMNSSVTSATPHDERAEREGCPAGPEPRRRRRGSLAADVRRRRRRRAPSPRPRRRRPARRRRTRRAAAGTARRARAGAPTSASTL